MHVIFLYRTDCTLAQENVDYSEFVKKIWKFGIMSDTGGGLEIELEMAQYQLQKIVNPEGSKFYKKCLNCKWYNFMIYSPWLATFWGKYAILETSPRGQAFILVISNENIPF